MDETVDSPIYTAGANMEKRRIEPGHDSVYLDYGPMLPVTYNQDVVMAMIRDPECIFTYWELSDSVAPETFRLRGLSATHTRWILRVVNLSRKNFFDIVLQAPEKIENVQGNYYLNVVPNTEYQLEIGLMDDRNKFISLVKSNVVRTPRKGLSPDTPSSPLFSE